MRTTLRIDVPTRRDRPVGVRRRLLLPAAAVLGILMLATGCSVRVDGRDHSVHGLDAGRSVEWDLTEPLEADALGLADDEMDVVSMSDDATVTLRLPRGTWTGHAEQVAVTTRHGYVDSVDAFWTEPDGQAAAARMGADADLLGVDAARVAGWAETAAWAETADITRPRVDAAHNGASGEVATTMSASMATGEGEGTPVRLWYKFYVRDVAEEAGAT